MAERLLGSETMMPRCYLNSYQPLAANAVGRAAVRHRGLPPLIDGSIRREPDLLHEFPGITCLCRANMFALRLEQGDRVAYMTKKNSLGQPIGEHHRLTAVLEVLESLRSHEVAATWYRSRNLPLPSNCMVPGNAPQALEASHRQCSCADGLVGPQLVEAWDREYQERAREYPTFVVCRRLIRDVSWEAPVITDDHFAESFGKTPSTQTPGALDCSQFDKFLKLVGVQLSSPRTPQTAGR